MPQSQSNYEQSPRMRKQISASVRAQFSDSKFELYFRSKDLFIFTTYNANKAQTKPVIRRHLKNKTKYHFFFSQ